MISFKISAQGRLSVGHMQAIYRFISQKAHIMQKSKLTCNLFRDPGLLQQAVASAAPFRLRRFLRAKLCVVAAAAVVTVLEVEVGTRAKPIVSPTA